MEDTPVSPSTPPQRIAIFGLVAALVAWFVWPAFHATYNEGFQATVAMTARAILDGGLASVDPLHGLDNDFMVHSRFGVSLALAGLMRLGMAAEPGFRLLMLGSLALLLGVNAGLLTWRYRIHPVLALIPALLFPGLFESAWFFNDNVLSAGLSSAALLLFWAGRSVPATIGAAALWGLAVACRTDAALLAPAFAVLGWFTLPSWGARLCHAAIAAPIAVGVPVLLYAAFGLNILDIVPLTRRATALWARDEPYWHVLQPVLKGFAAPGMLAVAVGAVSVLRQRRWLEIALCVAVPLLYVAAYGRMLTEVRYLLPLTPLFGILTIEGWRAVLAARPALRRGAAALLAAAVAACVVPPLFPGARPFLFMTADHDMPRPVLGRLWSPLIGTAWMGMLHDGADALAAALQARTAPGQTVVIVSTYWTPDRMVDLLLREQHLVLAQDGLPGACRSLAERYVGHGATAIHLRPHLPMIPTERTAITWAAYAGPCLDALHLGSSSTALVTGWTEVRLLPEGLTAAGVQPLLVPHPPAGMAEATMERRFSYWIALAPLSAVPALLQPALDQEVAAAREAASDPRIWTESTIPRVR